MTGSAIYTLVVCLALAALLVSVITASLERGGGLWPSVDHRLDLAIGLFALALAFAAGAQL